MLAEISLQILLVLGLASFRLTRLIVFDTITEFIRSPFMEVVEDEEGIFLEPKGTGLRRWMGKLLSCYWCTGIWVSAGLFALYVWVPIIGIPLMYVLAIAAIAAIIETINMKIMGG